MAVNVPNRGCIPNVADGAIVEVGATVDADGIHPDVMPPIAEPIAGHIATQVARQDLVVRAALTGDKALALRAVMEDPRRRATPARAARCSTNWSRARRPSCPSSPCAALRPAGGSRATRGSLEHDWGPV